MAIAPFGLGLLAYDGHYIPFYGGSNNVKMRLDQRLMMGGMSLLAIPFGVAGAVLTLPLGFASIMEAVYEKLARTGLIVNAAQHFWTKVKCLSRSFKRCRDINS